MLKAKMAGTGVGGTRCLQRSRGQSGVSCVPPMLCRLGQLSPQKSLSALPLLTCWSSFLEHSLCWSLSSLKESAEVTSVEQRWEKGPEMSELPSSHRKHRIEENELQGTGEVLFFLLSLCLWICGCHYSRLNIFRKASGQRGFCSLENATAAGDWQVCSDSKHTRILVLGRWELQTVQNILILRAGGW